MNKCPNCGKEFEGKFCPDCGAEWQEEKTCPKCGAKLNGSAKFCNECGYSFENKTKKPNKKVSVLDWVKSHLKIVIPVALAVVLIIVLACSIPACIAAQTNGTYYKLKSDGEIDKKTYFILSSGKWEDEDGEKGTYKKEGDKIIFFVEFFGETEELCNGTVKAGVLKIKDPLGTGTEDTYISEKHEHKFGEWETKKEATEASDGLEIRTCLCGEIEENILPASGTEGLSYVLNTGKNEYMVKGLGTAQKTEISIPSNHNNLPVTSIGRSAFYNCSGLTSVTIGNGVTEIGEYAFRDCSGLTSVTIGNGVTEIGKSAFLDCSRLTSVTIGNGVIEIGEGAFRGCSGLTSITIPDGVTKIGKSAFSWCSGLTSITIPDSVTSIGSYAFRSCSGLTSVTIGNGVTEIGNYAFWECSEATSIIVNDNNKKYYSENNCIIEKESKTLILGCKNSIIPDGVTSIGSSAFYNCSGLTSITIPDSVTYIGSSAFYNCSGLTSITIPNSVTTIDFGAFIDCSRLTRVIFEDASGWHRKNKYNNEFTEISQESLSNPSDAAKLIKQEYTTDSGWYYYTWKKY